MKLNKNLPAIILALSALPFVASAQALPGPASGISDNPYYFVPQPATGPFGAVSSIVGNTIYFTDSLGVPYAVDTTNALFEMRFGSPMDSSEISTGDIIEVTGTISGGNIMASVIRDISLESLHNTFDGKVNSVGSGQIVVRTDQVGTQRVNINGNTSVKANGQQTSASNIIVGATVHIVGVWNETKQTIAASEIDIKSTPSISNTETTGLISNIGINTISISDTNDTNYSVDTTNAEFWAGDETPIDPTDLTIGDKVNVEGSLNPATNNIVASRVVDLSLLPVEPEALEYGNVYNGLIYNVGVGNLSFTSDEGTNYYVDLPNAQLVRGNDAPADLLEFQVGNAVTVVGALIPGSHNILATFVEDRSIGNSQSLQ